MSDNLPPEVVQEELEARLRIPTEVWTDVFKLLPRRVLVQQIAPVCYYFKEISNKNVKNVHVIENADQFTDKLDGDLLEAIEGLEQLASNKCHLAGQFQLTELRVSDEKSKDLLRHSLDLLQGCQLSFDANAHSAIDRILFLDQCLTYLRSTKPVTITINQNVQDPDGTFWLNPTVQKCCRVVLNIESEPSDANLMSTLVAISHWLHHRPMDCDGAQQVRCMILFLCGHEYIDWLLDRCSQDIQQSQGPIDRRSFVLSFECWGLDWTGFDTFHRIENKSTGEVLLLDRVMNEDGQPIYRLRRCLAEAEASGPELYAGMFKHDYGDEFNIEEEATAGVIIGFG